MKKYIFALVLVFCILFVFVGCNNADATPDNAVTDETKPAPTAPQSVTFTINAFTFNGVDHQFKLIYGTGNTAVEKQINNITFTAAPGDIIEYTMEQAEYYDLQVLEVYDEFLGFMEYKLLPQDDGTTKYEKVSQTLYSVDELMGMKVPEYSVVYVAKWKNLGDDYYEAYGY